MNEYPKNYSGEIKVLLENGDIINQKQSNLRGGKLFPLDKKDVELKFLENLKYGKVSTKEIYKIKKFCDTFFIKPCFSLLS